MSPINLEKLIKDKDYYKKELSGENNILENPMNYFLNKQKKENVPGDLNKSESMMQEDSVSIY